MGTRRVRVRSWYAAGAGLLMVALLAACSSAGAACPPGPPGPEPHGQGDVGQGGPGRPVRPLRGSRRDPQDQACDHHHAGEPLVRLLLRHVSRRGRHPHEERDACGLRAQPERRLYPALPRPCGPQRRRAARRGQRGGRRERRQDERVHPAAGRGPGVLPRGQQPGLRRDPHPGRDGLPHGRGDPQLLEVRRELRARRPHVRAGEVVVAPGPPLHGVGVVGQVQEPLADELRQRHRGPLRGQQVPEGRGHRTAQRQGQHRPGLDRHHLAAVRAPRQLALLRAGGHPARLRGRRRRDLRGGQAERPDARDLEPAAAVRRRAGRPSAEQHPVRPAPTCTRPRRGPCPRSAGSSPPARTATTRPPASTGARPTSPRSSTPR